MIHLPNIKLKAAKKILRSFFCILEGVVWNAKDFSGTAPSLRPQEKPSIPRTESKASIYLSISLSIYLLPIVFTKLIRGR